MLIDGYIEGYYGRLLNWTDRFNLLNQLGELNVNFYIYGPKEDPLHRARWMDLYSAEQEENFKSFLEKSLQSDVKVYIAISPGLSYEKQSSLYLKKLFTKIDQFQEIGFTNFAIFFDDLELKQNQSLGKLHGDIVNQVRGFLRNDNENSLFFCPTVYSNRFTKGNLEDCNYLQGLSKTIDLSIPVFWTGQDVVSEKISNSDINDLKKILNNPILVWDNYYANDYCPTRFFIGPYKGRSFSEKTTLGFGINPTGLPITDSLIFSQVKKTLTTKQLLKKFEVPEAFLKILPFFSSPFDTVISKSNYKSLGDIKEIVRSLCIDWKSPLQLEWAPFLWSFFNDLNLQATIKTKRGKKSLEAWASPRYSDPLNKAMKIQKDK